MPAMPPPPVPFYSGRSVSAAETDGLLAIRPLRGHFFTTPPGTSVLYLPTATLVRAVVRRLEDPAWSCIEFHGEFSRVNHDSPVTLAAVASDDADALVRSIHARHKLPRIARRCAATALRDVQAVELVEVVGTYAPGHFEAADFAGLKLGGAAALRATLAPGRHYRVTGLLFPVPRYADDMARPVGYSGQRLHALAIAPAEEPRTFTRGTLAPVHGPRLQVAARSSTGPVKERHEEAAAIFQVGGGPSRVTPHADLHAPIGGEWPREPGVVLVVLDGVGGQGTGHIACEIALAGLATCLEDAPPPGRAARDAWLAALVARVASHLHASFDGQAGAAVALALVVADELYVAHLGDARVYSLRGDRLTALTTDHSLRNDAIAAGCTEAQLAELPDNVLTRMLGFNVDVPVQVASFDLQPGEVLLLATRGLHRELPADEIAATLRGLAAPDEACAALEARAERAGGRDNISVIVARVAD